MESSRLGIRIATAALYKFLDINFEKWRMAKLSSYYTLCPLIDQQTLLGVEKDKESGCAVVTLGRNIVIRYKVFDIVF